MNKKRITLLTIVLVLLIFSLFALCYDFSFITDSYKDIFYDFATGEKIEFTKEERNLFWSWYDSYYIISIIGIVFLSILIIVALYLLIKEFVAYYNNKEQTKQRKKDRLQKKKRKIAERLEDIE